MFLEDYSLSHLVGLSILIWPCVVQMRIIVYEKTDGNSEIKVVEQLIPEHDNFVNF